MNGRFLTRILRLEEAMRPPAPPDYSLEPEDREKVFKRILTLAEEEPDTERGRRARALIIVCEWRYVLSCGHDPGELLARLTPDERALFLDLVSREPYLRGFRMIPERDDAENVRLLLLAERVSFPPWGDEETGGDIPPDSTPGFTTP